MENTLENKAKFFAQHWGQYVISDIDNSKNKHLYPVDRSNMYRFDESHLLLKPLSSITDEDAVEVGKILQVFPEDVEDWINGDYVHEDFQSPFTFQHAIDYLRPKGYALPWMGLSVENLVEYGWVKLTENV